MKDRPAEGNGPVVTLAAKHIACTIPLRRLRLDRFRGLPCASVRIEYIDGVSDRADAAIPELESPLTIDDGSFVVQVEDPGTASHHIGTVGARIGDEDLAVAVLRDTHSFSTTMSLSAARPKVSTGWVASTTHSRLLRRKRIRSPDGAETKVARLVVFSRREERLTIGLVADG